MFYQKRIYLYFAPRSRMCDNPYKCGDGLDCIGESSEIKTVNGGWSKWSEWSELSDSYGCHSRYEMQCMCKILVIISNDVKTRFHILQGQDHTLRVGKLWK